VYSGGQFGNIAPSSIWVVNSDGTAPTAITDSVHDGVSPVWTTDGNGLLYVSNNGGGRDLYYQRIRGNGPEGAPQRLTTGLKIHGIAVGGDRLAYSLWNTSVGMWAAPVPTSGATSTQAARQITSASERIEAMNPSPDGQWLAFDSDRSGNSDIYKTRIDGTGLQQLTPYGLAQPHEIASAQWSPDGREIISETTQGRLFVVRPDGRGITPIHLHTGTTQYFAFEPDWSPDGTRIVFCMYIHGQEDIYTANADGSNLVQVTNSPEIENGPDWGRHPTAP